MLETTTTAVDTDHLDGAESRDATPPAPPAAPEGSEQALVQADLLVEDVSIDGMCGVY
jgi:mycofactocin precursor